MIGAFYQPSMVIIDTLTLNTLPKREVNAGLAEVIKYGAILDYEFFEWLEQHIDELVALHPEALSTLYFLVVAKLKRMWSREMKQKRAIVHCSILDILLDMPLKLT